MHIVLCNRGIVDTLKKLHIYSSKLTNQTKPNN